MEVFDVERGLHNADSPVNQSPRIKLVDYLLSKTLTRWFLNTTFLEYPIFQSPTARFIAKNGVRFIILFAVALVIIDCIDMGTYFMNSGEGLSKFLRAFEDATGIIVWMSFIISYIATAYSYYHVFKHLKSDLIESEIAHFDTAASICFKFFSFFVLLVLIGVCLMQDGSPYVFFISLCTVIVQVYTTCGVCINMFFMIVDTRTSAGLVTDALSLSSMEKLRVEKLIEIREQVEGRVATAKWSNSIMGACAVLNAVSLILVLFYLRVVSESDTQFKNIDMKNSTKELFLIAQALIFISMLLKEVIYLAIVLFEVADVNDKADQLMDSFTKLVWTPRENDNERLRLYVNFSGTPVTFDLLGMRPTRNMVYLEVTGYVVSVLIAVLQTTLNPDLLKAERIAGY